MTLPGWLFEALLWGALLVVAATAVFLLAVLVREWRDGTLW